MDDDMNRMKRQTTSLPAVWLAAVLLCCLSLTAPSAMARVADTSVIQALRIDEPALAALADVYQYTAVDLGLDTAGFTEWHTLVLIAEHHSERADTPGKGLLLWALTEFKRPEVMTLFRSGLVDLRHGLSAGGRVNLADLLAIGRGMSAIQQVASDDAFRTLAADPESVLDASWRRSVAETMRLKDDAVDHLCGTWNGMDGTEIEEALRRFLVNRVVFQLMREGFPSEPLFLYIDGDVGQAQAALDRLLDDDALAGPVGGTRDAHESAAHTDLAAMLASRVDGLIRDAAGVGEASLDQMSARERLKALVLASMSVGTDIAFKREVGVQHDVLTRFGQDIAPVEFDARATLSPAPISKAEPATPSLEELRARADLLRQELSQRAREARESMQGQR